MALNHGGARGGGVAPACVALLVVAVSLVSILMGRIDRAPLQPYGADSAQYIEHLARLETLQAIRDQRGSGDWGRLLREADNAFPPLLHLITVSLGEYSGHRAEDVVWSGLLWLFLLAGSIGLAGFALSRRVSVGLAAATAGLLLPAAHAFATRYYYDLPMMAALWAAVAAGLLLWERRPVLGGVLAGLLWLAACLLKWLALPFGAPMLVGAALCSTGAQSGGRRRLRGLLLTCAVCAVLVVAYLAVVGPHHSLRAMLNDVVADPVGDAVPEAGDGVPISAVSQPEPPVAGLQAPTVLRLVFYPLRLLTSVFSPGLSLLALFLGAVWLRGPRAGMPLLVTVVLGHGAFLLFAVRPLDDRFVLVGAPLGVLVGVLGWQALSPSLRKGVGVLTLVLGLLVALDFHSSFTLPGSSSEVELIRVTEQPGVAVRGLSLVDSVEQRGWSRWSEDQDNKTALREQLWKTLAHCSAMKLRIAAEDPIVSEHGDLFWFKYRALYAWLEEQPPTPLIMEDAQPAFFGPPQCRDSTPGETELAVSGARRGEEPVRPPCVDGSWVLEGVLPLDSGSNFAAIWSPKDQLACDPLRVDGAPPPSSRPAPPVVESQDPGRSWRCETTPADVTPWDPCACNADYMEFPQRAARWADPADSCDGLLEDLVAKWEGGWDQPRPPIPDLSAADLQDSIMEALNIRFLVEGDGELLPLDERPITVTLLNERERGGYRQLELEFMDPFVGSFQGLLLLPPGSGPFPALIALPGHNETAAIHRDDRSGDLFVAEGYATLLLTFRAYDTGLAEHQASLHLLCQGFSLMGIRVYEALLGLKYLAHRADIDGSRMGVIGHSGGSVTANLLIRVQPERLRASVSDLTAIHFNIGPPLDEGGGGHVGDETSYALARLSANINDFSTAAVPVFPVEYGYTQGLGGAVRFLDRHVKGEEVD